MTSVLAEEAELTVGGGLMASVLAEQAELTESISLTSSWPLDRSDLISSRCKQCRGYTQREHRSTDNRITYPLGLKQSKNASVIPSC